MKFVLNEVEYDVHGSRIEGEPGWRTATVRLRVPEGRPLDSVKRVTDVESGAVFQVRRSTKWDRDKSLEYEFELREVFVCDKLTVGTVRLPVYTIDAQSRHGSNGLTRARPLVRLEPEEFSALSQIWSGHGDADISFEWRGNVIHRQLMACFPGIWSAAPNGARDMLLRLFEVDETESKPEPYAIEFTLSQDIVPVVRLERLVRALVGKQVLNQQEADEIIVTPTDLAERSRTILRRLEVDDVRAFRLGESAE